MKPDSRTLENFARSSSVQTAIPGQPLYASDEYNHRLVRMDVNADGSTSNLTHFANVGEFGIAVDRNARVYVADGYIYVYTKTGELEKIIDVPERPTSLVVGGKEDNILFITARSSLYRYVIQ